MLDPGFRIHTTSFSRDTAASPSVFVQRLRKLLGTRRVTSVKQIGTDRILEIQFSEGTVRLYLEFYGVGNVVVTDAEQKVLAVQKVEEKEGVKVGGLYKLEEKQNVKGVRDVDEDRVREMLKVTKEEDVGDGGTTGKKRWKKPLRKAIAKAFNEFPGVLIEHAEAESNFDLEQAPAAVFNSDELVKHLTDLLQTASNILKSVSSSKSHPGYIISKPPTTKPPEAQDKDSDPARLMYVDYQPFKPKQYEANPSTYTILEFDSFSAAVDKFYSSIEGQKLGSKRTELEENAKKKLEATRKLHQERLGGLQKAQEIHIRKAEAIQANVERVQEACFAVNGLVAQGMDWVDISRLIEAEQARGNPVAGTIKLPLKLDENTITLLLAEADGKEESEDTVVGSSTDADSSDSEEDRPRASTAQTQNRRQDERLSIDIDLSLTAWANASLYYDQKKQAASKHERTEQISTLAIRNAERKITADLHKGLSHEKDILRPLRQAFWFEKFYYFVSSDGHLVLAGKDAIQTELLYQKYFRPGDVFVHADVPGAAVTVIKNFGADRPVPPGTLSQAGTFSVLSSSAWDSKALMAAWWVTFEQVSKISDTAGDVLPAGKFEVKGQKSYLPPAQLLAGVAVVFGVGAARERMTEADVNPDLKDENDGEMENVAPDQAAEKTVETNGDEDEDSDDDYPDTAAPALTYDSDEDFPDVSAPVVADSDEEEEQESNPLQPVQASTPQPTQSSSKKAIESITDDNDNANANTEHITSSPSSHKHLSAHQRRLYKKTGVISSSSLTKATEDQEEAYESDGTTATFTTLNTIAQANRNALLPRGKRSKLKKAKQKYAEQDEDDRAAALAKLGSRIGEERREAEAQARRAKAEAEEVERNRMRLRKEQHAKRLEENRVGTINATGNGSSTVDTQVDGDDMDLSVLATLTGKPRATDDIIFALPVFAPWTALASFKYKTKLQPGSVKKGKAAKEILGKWQVDGKVTKYVDKEGKDPERMWPREVECMAGIKDTEVIACMSVRGVRIMMSGATANAGKGGKGDKGKVNGKGGGKKKK
jgi:predicted ribosome quality control (RQC) complex YloA/Tae2 family protein